MNYPFWYIPTLGGSLLIAIVAIVHVYIAHLAVGGGFFLVVTEHIARKKNDTTLLDYVRKHTWFFLLLTMVFGGMTGVGIWFTIALIHPQATSSLIHIFVFGWAIEWVFFIIEITALLIYHYRFDQLSPKHHLIIGWIYFAAAWLSLFIINGILSFMLTPGDWVQDQSFWSGFFNPSFFPSLVFRSAFALSIAGLFGFITTVRIKDAAFNKRLVKYCSNWVMYPFLILVPAALWYASSLNPESLINIQKYNPEPRFFLQSLLVCLIAILGLAYWLRKTRKRTLQIILVIVIVPMGLAWIGSFEYLREIARKPYVIQNYMYSTGITRDQVKPLNKKGIYSQLAWHQKQEIGQALMTRQCLSCHTLGGYNDLLSRTKKYSLFGMQAFLSGQGKVTTYMPPFVGTEKEKATLASFIVEHLHHKKAPFEDSPAQLASIEASPNTFNPKKDDYTLLAFNDLGMHCLTDNDKYFVLLPPANTLYAQLIKRGKKPHIVTDNIRLEYQAEDGFQKPEQHVPFWQFSQKIFGANLKPPIGLAGNGVNGTLQAHRSPLDVKYYSAHAIPVVPYHDNGSFNPYPLATVTAYDAETNQQLAQTTAVLPTSTEMGCRNCHGGPWKKEGLSGVSDQTSSDILATHDRISGTDLLKQAQAGQPMLCQKCHADPALQASGEAGVLNLSAAVHGFHAHFLNNRGADACAACHPAKESGRTRCLRGAHAGNGITCVECHGYLEDHALSLLKHEKINNKEGAERLMKELKSRSIASVANINPRMPWLNEPDCLTCHVDYQPAENADSFNHWAKGFDALYRNRADSKGVMCASCHGSPHAIYPATNPYHKDRDNLQPLQYQNLAGPIAKDGNCQVCHTNEPTSGGHHPGMKMALRK